MSIRTVLKKVKSAAKWLSDDSDDSVDFLEPRHSDERPGWRRGVGVEEFVDTRLSEALDRLKTSERINREYFDVIERIERERDQWKDMFFTQASEHQNAQAMLQKMLTDCSNNLRGALSQLNFFRSGAKLEPVMTPQMLEHLPTTLPEDYGDLIKKLADSAMEQTDGRARRAEIAASSLI